MTIKDNFCSRADLKNFLQKCPRLLLMVNKLSQISQRHIHLAMGASKKNHLAITLSRIVAREPRCRLGLLRRCVQAKSEHTRRCCTYVQVTASKTFSAFFETSTRKSNSWTEIDSTIFAESDDELKMYFNFKTGHSQNSPGAYTRVIVVAFFTLHG